MTARDRTDWLRHRLPEALPAFLPERRWFGGKGRGIRGVAFEDAAWLPDDQRPTALVVVRVRDTEDVEVRYALVAAFERDPGPLPVIGWVPNDAPGAGPESRDSGTAAWCVVEAAADRRAGLALLYGFASSGRRELPTIGGGVLRYADADALAARLLDAGPTVRPMGAEQSNTSLRIEPGLAFKLFRRVDRGENPEVEIGRFLATRTTFRDLPVLRGSIGYRAPDGELATVGVLQDLLDTRGDGWSHMVALLGQRDDPSAAAALRADAFALGLVTERLHRALATPTDDPAFASEPVGAADVEAWRRDIDARARRAAQRIEQELEVWPPRSRSLGALVVAHRHQLAVPQHLPDPALAPFRKIRVHGDYHLGQTLTVPTGFAIIDFEGEPARPIAERRARQPALKDVAGMLRSFDYAVEAARAGGESREDDVQMVALLRHRFLDGYRATFADSPPVFAPADPVAMQAWINMFELEKALYEVEYEIDNRPAWVHIPLRGLARLLQVRAPSGA